MGIAEILLSVVFVFGIGFTSGKQADKQATDKQTAVRPDRWKPAEHEEFLTRCSVMCGEGNLKEYNILYGKCKCK